MRPITGFYGKLPSHGDFLSRRLPRQFIEPWDQWLQGGLAASREQLGKAWLKTYLVSPIWEFALAPGLCGEDAWAGVMMPSVDKVGRYFPLTLAAKVEHGRLARLFDPGCGWFDALSQLALSTLEYDFDLADFDARLERLSVADFLVADDHRLASLERSGSGRVAFQFLLEDKSDSPRAFVEMGRLLGERFLGGGSYWRSAETEASKTIILLCEGLPPLDAYIGFLNGDWPRRGWNLYSDRLSAEFGYDAPVDNESAAAGGDSDAGFKAASSQTIDSSVACDASSEDSQGRPEDKSETPEKITHPKKTVWESCALSVVGQRRQLNEDAVLNRPEAGLWAVADGMGGHSAGDVASQALVAALADLAVFDDLEHYSEQVAFCLHGVNRDLLKMAENRACGQIIGSTVVVLLASGSVFRYLWAGDSRLYLFRHGTLEQLTVDHSLYNESLSLGMTPLDGSLEEGRGNVITRAIGADRQLQLDLGQGVVQSGDVFILCSDGLDKELSHGDIADLCRAGSVETIAHQLVEEAERRGGRDNISVVVVKAPEVGKSA